MHGDERAASEVVGTALLVAVVVLAVTTFTAATLLDRAFDDTARADVTANLTESRVVLNHTGGDAVDAADVSVIVRGGGSEFRTDGLDSVGDEFDPGEGWSTGHGLALAVDDRARVLVVHDNRTVLFDATRRVYPD